MCVFEICQYFWLKNWHLVYLVFHWEAFSLIVFVQLLFLTIWCCSLLIMIISKSLSCIVHLCNNVFWTPYSWHTPAHRFIPTWKQFSSCQDNELQNQSSLKTEINYNIIKIIKECWLNTILIWSSKKCFCSNFSVVEFGLQEQWSGWVDISPSDQFGWGERRN